MYFPVSRSLPARPEPDNAFWTASTVLVSHVQISEILASDVLVSDVVV